MPKVRTHRSTAKRIRRTGTGKLMRRRANRSHILEKKLPGRKRRLGRMSEVAAGDRKRVRRMLGGSR